jgi:hypothetical protein
LENFAAERAMRLKRWNGVICAHTQPLAPILTEE